MRLLAQEGEVFTGDRITTGTGARAVLKLGAATELRMGSAARIRIDRFLINAGGVIDLDQGAVMIDKAPASGGSLSLRSSHGLIAVRGTRFYAGPSNGVLASSSKGAASLSPVPDGRLFSGQARARTSSRQALPRRRRPAGVRRGSRPPSPRSTDTSADP